MVINASYFQPFLIQLISYAKSDSGWLTDLLQER